MVHPPTDSCTEKNRRGAQGLEKEKFLTDLDYADDVALTAEQITSAQQLLISFEKSAAKVGLFLKTKKSERMVIEGPVHLPITSLIGTQIKEVDEYLGSFVADSRKDFLFRKGQAFSVCNNLNKLSQSGSPKY